MAVPACRLYPWLHDGPNDAPWARQQQPTSASASASGVRDHQNVAIRIDDLEFTARRIKRGGDRAHLQAFRPKLSMCRLHVIDVEIEKDRVLPIRNRFVVGRYH